MNTAVLDAARRRSDFRTIALIGLAHGSSHFHHLLLPPLFPVFIREFALSWSELGLLVTVFFVISGIGQALSGFLVDRVGARPVLMAAMACFALASLAAGTATGYSGLVLAACLAGLGNCPFHPADFTVLNQRVSPKRLAHAFSVHGVSGSLGWAATPVLLIGIEQASGNWRLAYAATAMLALAVLQKKKEKHSHTEGRRRNASGCSCGAAAAAAAADRRAAPPSSIDSRPHHNIASTASASIAVAA
jgi:MFS transporter, FSR family, fosmidomycin resistance protein